ncbi:hypothetical protein P9112_004474 [Eukaryota sp. TZLM1-RC]
MAGIGRTGVLICMLEILTRSKEGTLAEFDLDDFIYFIRTRRCPFMVETVDHTNGHLNKAEDRKRDKYTEILNDLNKNLYSKFSFVPFAFSIFGNIGQSALNFINDFGNLCSSSGKNFAGNLWKNRIIFALYRSVPKYLSLMMSKLYKDSSRVGVENLVSYVF